MLFTINTSSPTTVVRAIKEQEDGIYYYALVVLINNCNICVCMGIVHTPPDYTQDPTEGSYNSAQSDSNFLETASDATVEGSVPSLKITLRFEAQLITFTYEVPAIHQRFPWPSLWVDWFGGAAHRTQRTHILERLLDYYYGY